MKLFCLLIQILKKLEIYYDKNYNKAYYDIRKFLLSKGFEAIGDSDYIHNNMYYMDVVKLISNYSEEEKWLALCCVE